MVRLGYRVLAEVETSAEAEPLVGRLAPDLAILGQTDTSTAALQVVEKIRGRHQTALILLTPVPSLAWVASVRRAGTDALLARPPREAELLAAVELSLARREEVRTVADERDALRDRLETNSLVRQAIEVLQRTESIPEQAAHERLRRQAERTGRPLRQIAQAVLLADSVLPGR